MNRTLQQVLVNLSHGWSFFVWGFALLCVIAGIFAQRYLNRSRASGDVVKLRRAKTAYALAISCFVVSIVALGLSIAHVGCSYTHSEEIKCRSNLKQLALAIQLYAQDYDERMPPAKRWAELISPKYASPDSLKCPSATTPFSFGMNAAVAGASWSELANEDYTKIPVLFEADAPVLSFSGGMKDVAKFRHTGRSNITFMDGHDKIYPYTLLDTLAWKPKIESPAQKSKP